MRCTGWKCRTTKYNLARGNAKTTTAFHQVLSRVSTAIVKKSQENIMIFKETCISWVLLS